MRASWAVGRQEFDALKDGRDAGETSAVADVPLRDQRMVISPYVPRLVGGFPVIKAMDM